MYRPTHAPLGAGHPADAHSHSPGRTDGPCARNDLKPLHRCAIVSSCYDTFSLEAALRNLAVHSAPDYCSTCGVRRVCRQRTLEVCPCGYLRGERRLLAWRRDALSELSLCAGWESGCSLYAVGTYGLRVACWGFCRLACRLWTSRHSRLLPDCTSSGRTLSAVRDGAVLARGAAEHRCEYELMLRALRNVPRAGSGSGQTGIGVRDEGSTSYIFLTWSMVLGSRRAWNLEDGSRRISEWQEG